MPETLTQQELESRLWAAANSLRGPVDPSDFKAYIFPLLFYKRLSDGWDEEHARALADYGGDETLAAQPENHRFQIPEGSHWRDLRRAHENVGVALQRMLDRIQEASQTGQEKLYGLVVDYVGIGNELAKAVAVRDTGERKALPPDVDELLTVLAERIGICLARFDVVDRNAPAFEQLLAAQEQLATKEQREAFAAEFLACEGLFEFLWPDTALRPVENDYRWVAKVYKSIEPTGAANELLWHRLGAKTLELIAEHVNDVEVDATGLEEVAVDAEVFEALRQLDLFPPAAGEAGTPPTVEDVLDTLEARLQRKLAGTPHPVWTSLADRLEALR